MNSSKYERFWDFPLEFVHWITALVRQVKLENIYTCKGEMDRMGFFVLNLILTTLEFSLNGVELSLNSGNSENRRNHWSMKWVQYKDLLCYLCLCGLGVSSLSLTQEILGSSPTLALFIFYSFFVTEFSEFSENI